jgi:hypothetical protein
MRCDVAAGDTSPLILGVPTASACKQMPYGIPAALPRIDSLEALYLALCSD